MERYLDQISAQLTVRCIKDRKNPVAKKGYKITSQHEEDGIIEEIFDRIGIIKPNFVEIGADMTCFENNSTALAIRGCKGVWIDMNKPQFKINREKLLCISTKVTPKNTKELINKSVNFLGSKSINMMSLDIDSNDYYILREVIKGFDVDCFVIEYNANWGKSNAIYSKFEDEFNRSNGDYYGMSLKAAINLLKNYTLICCNITGVNAFFVNNRHLDKFGDCILKDPTDHFMPPTHKYHNFRLGGSITTTQSFYKHTTNAEYD